MANDTDLQVPAQAIPVPTSISPEAQAFLAGAARRLAAKGAAPGVTDLEASAAAAIQMLAPAADMTGAGDTRVTNRFIDVNLHGGFMGMAPEDRENMAECKRFCEQAWGIAG